MNKSNSHNKIKEEVPLVSITCITYNHESYIRECLEGFLMQKTNFEYEILIHDDASTDKTADIIREYEKKYPGIIKPIYQVENQYSQGVRGIFAKYNFSRAKGKYIAMCEGDDYWTDPYKLQKQVDFLEENEDCAMVFTNAEVIIEDDGEKSNSIRGLREIKESRFFSDIEILEHWTVPTASVIFRSIYIDEKYSKILSNKNFMFGDIVLFLHLSTKGELFGMKEIMVAYRRHVGGVTNFNLSINLDRAMGNHYLEIINVFGNKFKKPLASHIGRVYFSLAINALKNKNFKYFFADFMKVIRHKPSLIITYIVQRTKS
ncbi:glycosyltransferase family 2 protein [Aequorivita sinensis]|uniref:glycosyltransferase family 2 protein n=1 Tax=Aequorivita sinensis TaxID=1382458 RepID=UPI0023013F7F|nr:glycosyltransferase [Aequorivita sinensis]